MIVTIVCLVVIAALGASLLRSLVAEHRQTLRRRDQMQAFWLAESAVQRGVVRVEAASDYTGEEWQVETDAGGRRVPARATIRIEAVAGEAQARRIVVEARYPADGAATVLQQREMVVILDQPGETP
jgi:Tfp pilus assembly protein PilX